MINNLLKYISEHFQVLIKNSFWVLLSNILKNILLLIQSVLFARYLGVESLGAYVLIVAFIDTSIQFLNPNLGTASIRFISKYKEQDRYDLIVSFIKLSIIIVLCIMILGVLLIPSIYVMFNYSLNLNQGLYWVIFFLASVKTIALLDGINIGLLRVFNKFKINSIFDMSISILDFVVIVIALIFYKPLFTDLLILSGITLLIRAIGSSILVYFELGPILKEFKVSNISLLRRERKEIVKFVLPNSISQTIKTIHTKIDVIILGALTNNSAVGIYSIAKKLAGFLVLIIDPMTNAIYPQIASMIFNKKLKDLKFFLKELISITAIILGLGTITVIIWGKDIINVIYGTQYLTAYIPFIILLITINYNQIFFWILPISLTLNMTSQRLMIDILNMIIGISLSFILVPIYGIMGSVIALGTTYVLGVSLLLFYIFIYKDINRLVYSN